MAEAAKGLGRPKVGGMFELLDHEGRAFTDQDMKGGFSLVSFKVFLVGRDLVRDLGKGQSGSTLEAQTEIEKSALTTDGPNR